ncbi:flagellar basal body P-ring formation chaperone FlgA [Maridesulfovibrio frigidus]|uniref:flagellar basal body P-ring formation chaperone FlgA n=1 Tax=Maridesulfovibrio frigidus TaxID=340956 RepID=UPI0004E10A9F|nr:flagellar basal body P-ring formation chaperone FlgA [Maridesulfovibrio frigidus]
MTLAERYINLCRVSVMILVIAAITALVVVSADAATKQNSDWRIVIKSAATVDGPRVLLGDIAEFYGDLAANTKRDLSDVELWNAPAAGRKPVRVNSKKLKVILKHYLGDMISHCVLPPTLTVQSGGRVMNEEQLKRVVVKVLTPHAVAMGGDYKFRNFKLPDHLFYADSMDSLKIKITRTIVPGNNSFKMEIVSVDGRVLRAISGGVFVDLWKPVPCPVRPLNRKEVITPDLITWKNKNMAHMGNRAWDGKGGPWRIKIPVGTGQPIMKSSIEPAPVISKGDRVSLVFKGKHIRLTVPVEALEDAGVGQSITVRNLQSKRKVVGKVVNAQTVSVR